MDFLVFLFKAPIFKISKIQNWFKTRINQKNVNSEFDISYVFWNDND
jgi:hypothetical protein